MTKRAMNKKPTAIEGLLQAPEQANDRSPHQRSPNSYLMVADQLRSLILNGRLKPEDRLPSEMELSRQFGVGRTTLREALRLLASERLIETRRGVQGGAFVTHPSSADIDDALMTAIRLMTMSGEITNEELLEAGAIFQPELIRLAIERASHEEALELVALGEALTRTRDDIEWVEVGRAFNHYLARLTGNQLLGIFIKPLLWLIASRFREGRLTPGWRARSAASYLHLAHAVRDRSPEAAAAALREMSAAYDPVLHPQEASSVGVT